MATSPGPGRWILGSAPLLSACGEDPAHDHAWERFPNRELPREPIPDLVPDLAVEVLSESNTEAEMERKLREYFAAGVRLVWYVEPEPRRVRAYTIPADVRVQGETETLDGGTVLPGFQLSIRDWFDRAGRRRSG